MFTAGKGDDVLPATAVVVMTMMEAPLVVPVMVKVGSYINQRKEAIMSLVDGFVDGILECFNGTPEGKARIKQASYEKDGVEFFAVEMCPENEDDLFSVDIVKVMEVFDSVNFCQVRSHLKGKDTKYTPCLRVMGEFQGHIFMLDLHLQKMDL
jgi:hypothetical protein